MECTYYADKIFKMLNESQAYEEITADKDKNVLETYKGVGR